MRIQVDGEELTVSAALNKLSDQDRAVREAAGRAIGEAFGEQHAAVLADHQHARQGQGDHRHLAPLSAPGQLPQPRQHGRGRGGGRAGRRGRRRLSAAVAPLLHAEGELARPATSCSTGTATRRCRTTTTAQIAVARGARRGCSTAYGAFSPELAEIGRRFFDAPWIDAALRPGKAGGAFAHPDRAVGASLSAAELSWPHARRDDAGARARPWRAPGAGRRIRAI